LLADITFWKWRGYYDCTDVNYFDTDVVSDDEIYGVGSGEYEWSRLDHCEYELRAPREASAKKDLEEQRAAASKASATKDLLGEQSKRNEVEHHLRAPNMLGECAAASANECWESAVRGCELQTIAGRVRGCEQHELGESAAARLPKLR
jgi:hypothetical protein